MNINTPPLPEAYDKVLLRGAIFGFLFALVSFVVGWLFVFVPGPGAIFQYVTFFGVECIYIPAVLPFTRNAIDALSVLLWYFAFWTILGTVASAILNGRTRKQKTIIWILFCILYATYAWLVLRSAKLI